MKTHGHIQKGTIILDEALPLPEGKKVEVDIRIDAAMENWDPEVKKYLGIIPSQVDIEETFISGKLLKRS
ncbi:MAG: hypothetical protein NTX50_06160 [Candidatus Sumerlaeota bacterium]|nr:hypothetical protein [Candidatus Sumerlaeota bacterium]